MKTKNEELVSKIVDLELKMFTEMHDINPIEAENMPMFKRMRMLYYSALSDKTLEIWLRDLNRAYKNGRNVIIEKYAMLSGKLKIMKIKSMAEKNSLDEADLSLKDTIKNSEKKELKTSEKISAEDKVTIIAEQERLWKDELMEEYPLAIRQKCAAEENLEQSLYCELHTWSEESIDSYFEDVYLAKKRNVNLNEKRFNNYYKSKGQGSLAEVEEILRNKKNKSRIKKNKKLG